jgi:hypothetical protein
MRRMVEYDYDPCWSLRSASRPVVRFRESSGRLLKAYQEVYKVRNSEPAYLRSLSGS